MDLWHRLLSIIDHNRYLAASLVVSTVASAWLGACSSQTASLVDPSVQVSRITFRMQTIAEEQELSKARADLAARAEAINARIVAHNAKVEAGDSDLDRQDAVKAQIVDALGGAVAQAVTGTLNPVGLATTIVGLGGAAFGVGAFADKRRADSVIVDLKGKLLRSTE